LNDQFEIGFGTEIISPTDVGIKIHLIVVDRWGKPVFESLDYQNDWDASDLAGGVYYVTVNVGDLTTCKGWVHVVK
jgi:hypothetical protein